MKEYSYERSTISDGRRDIDNPLRVDGEGNQIHLSKEIESALPGKNFKLKCHGDNAVLIFDNDLSSEEENLLSQVVISHKNNS
jgi:hypothetical protein